MAGELTLSKIPDMVLRDRSSIPGHEWAAFVPETGATLRSPSRVGLIPMVAAHLRANNLPAMLDPEEDIDSYICAAMSERQRGKRCTFCSGETRPEHVKIGVNDALGFVDFVTKNGWSFVTPEEAERRASICASCPWNLPLAQHCPTCEAAKLLVEGAHKISGSRTTSHDRALKNCGVCGCFLKVKVHVQMSDDYRPGREYPAWCWAKNEGSL